MDEQLLQGIGLWENGGKTGKTGTGKRGQATVSLFSDEQRKPVMDRAFPRSLAAHPALAARRTALTETRELVISGIGGRRRNAAKCRWRMYISGGQRGSEMVVSGGRGAARTRAP